MPSGVTLSSTGVLSGTPAAGSASSYPITITAANGVLPNATQSFTLTVNSAPVITSAAAATFAVGSAGSFTVVASGSPAPAFSETGGLPSGVTLSSTGVLSGTPAAGSASSYPITITASNGVLPNATQSFTLTVNAAGSAPVISECRGGDVCGGLGGVVYGGGVGFSGAGVLGDGCFAVGGDVEFGGGVVGYAGGG